MASYTVKRNSGEMSFNDGEDEDYIKVKDQKYGNESPLNTSKQQLEMANINSESTSSSTPSTPDAKQMDDIFLDGSKDNDDLIPESTALLLSNHHQRTSEMYNKIRPVTAKPSLPCDDILSRRQTQEWKGWMMVCFLAYRLTNAASLQLLSGGGMETIEEDYHNIFFNLSRTFVTSFVWLTGYSHFSYFYKHNDYSSVRVVRILWRINFLAFFLCLTHGNDYILYFMCPIQSYFFLMVYSIMRVNKKINYDRYKLRIKLLGAAGIIYLIWDMDLGLFKLFHLPFFTAGPRETGATSGPMWEWYFRSFLDHWAAFFGMIFASNAPIASLLIRKLEAQHTLEKRVLGKIITGISLILVVLVWANGPLRASVLEYNATHCYFGFIPILAYIFFRNSTIGLRKNTLDLFHSFGEATLEAFLIHHHVLFTSDGGTILTIIPGYPKINLFVILLAYILTSRKLYQITKVLSIVLLPNDKKKCGRAIGILAVVVASFYALASALERLDVMNMGAIAVVCIICGILLYQTILDMTWKSYRGAMPETIENDSKHLLGHRNKMHPNLDVPPVFTHLDDENPVAKISPPLIGTFAVFFMGIVWHSMALTGAGIIEALPPNCAIYANNGQWLPVDFCNEGERGKLERDFSVTSYGNFCDNGIKSEQPMVWGWRNTDSRSLCRLKSFDSKNLRSRLNHRSLVFIGDSMVRNFYHAVCRALGEINSGTYDATIPHHSDITKIFGNTKLEYKWAPLAVDELEKLKEYKNIQEENAPDLLVLGGGAWDRLHVWATDEDQDSLKVAVSKLAQELERMKKKGIPAVWLTPTTINTNALNHEEKRSQMSEEGLQEMRRLYAELGVLASASFVLDGQSLTQDRVNEAYDGIHYPPQVYDAGAQILANAMDWVLPTRYEIALFYPPEPGTMANISLAVMILCFVAIGLFFFDSFLGFSYLASVFVNDVMPSDLYDEAFGAYHAKMKIHGLLANSPKKERRHGKSKKDQNNEMLAFANRSRGDLDLSVDMYER